MKVCLRMVMMGVLAFSMLAWMAAAADVTGVWEGALTDVQGHQHHLTLNLKEDGGEVTGTVTLAQHSEDKTSDISDGTMAGDQITFDVNAKSEKTGDAIAYVYKGKVAGNQIQGTVNIGTTEMQFSVTKK